MPLTWKHIIPFQLLPALLLLSGNKALPQTPSFEPCTDACGIEDVADITDLYGNGLAAADYDNDGDIDFYLPTEAGISDRLYRNDGRGKFEDVALGSGIEEWQSNRAALWFDYNGDHRLDLLVAGEACVNRTCARPVLLSLYAQRPDATFINVTLESGIDAGTAFDDLPFYGIGGLAAADFDLDQYLDLILTVWGGGLQYFHNNGDGTFTDLTQAVGLNNSERMYWQCMAYDFNRDGLIDLYCNVDYHENQLWINRGQVFEERAGQYGLDNAFNEMGMTVGDYDNDGDIDIYATNITRMFQGQDQHNLLYRNDVTSGRIHFSELASDLGTGQSGWDWGTTFIDIDNDGRQDLATTNGWNDAFWGPDRSTLWLNTQTGFVDISDRCGFNDQYSATTLVAFDYDRDGDLDLLQSLKDNADTKKPVIIYENKLEETGSSNHFMVIKPRMPGGNHFAIGSEVTLRTSNWVSTRLITAGSSFYGQEPAEAFFGLGNREQSVEVSIRWPDQQVSIYRNIPPDKVITLDYERITPPADLKADTTRSAVRLSWEDHSDGETGFLIHRARDSLFRQYDRFFAGPNVTTYLDEDIADGIIYHYRISAFNERVASAYSNTALAGPFEPDAWPSPPNGELLLFPNPTRGDISIKLPAPIAGPVEIAVIDYTGRNLWTRTYILADPTEMITEALGLPHGIYFLQVQTAEWKIQRKLVVLH